MDTLGLSLHLPNPLQGVEPLRFLHAGKAVGSLDLGCGALEKQGQWLLLGVWEGWDVLELPGRWGLLFEVYPGDSG